LVDGRPGATLGLAFAEAALFIALLDMLGLALLLAGVFRLVTTGHGYLLKQHTNSEQTLRSVVPGNRSSAGLQHVLDRARDPGHRQRLGEYADSGPAAEAFIVFAVTGEIEERDATGL